MANPCKTTFANLDCFEESKVTWMKLITLNFHFYITSNFAEGVGGEVLSATCTWRKPTSPTAIVTTHLGRQGGQMAKFLKHILQNKN